MRHRARCSAILLVCSILFMGGAGALPVPSSFVAAEPPPFPIPQDGALVVYSLPSLADRGDTLRLAADLSIVSLSFDLPEGWQPAADGRLDVGYDLHDSAAPRATLRVRLNRWSAAPVALADGPGRHEIALPAGALRPGDNLLEIEVQPEDDAGLPPSITLSPQSALYLPVQMTAPRLSEDLPPAQLDLLIGDGALTFVLPPVPLPEELDALSAAVLALAQAERDAVHTGASTPDMAHWRIVPADRFSGVDVTGPVVMLGAAGRCALLDTLAPVDMPHAISSGWVTVLRPDWAAGHPVLAIGGGDSRAVRRAAQALLDPVTRLRMDGNYGMPAGEWPVPSWSVGEIKVDEYSLESMWVTFALASRLGDLALILPENAGFEDLADAAALVRVLGHVDAPVVSAPRWVHTEAAGRDLRSASLIVMGESARQPFLAYSLGHRLLVPLTEVRGLPNGVDGRNVGVIQVIPSPWTVGRMVLAVSGSGPDGYRAALDALLNENTRAHLIGQAVVVTREIERGTLELYAQSTSPSDALPTRHVPRWTMGMSSSPWTAILLVSAIMTVLAGLSALGTGLLRRVGGSAAGGRVDVRSRGGAVG